MDKDTKIILAVVMASVVVVGIVFSIPLITFLLPDEPSEWDYVGVEATIVYAGEPMDRQAIYDFVHGNPEFIVVGVSVSEESEPFHWLRFRLSSGGFDQYDYEFQIYMHSSIEYDDFTISYLLYSDSSFSHEDKETAMNLSAQAFQLERRASENITAILVGEFDAFLGATPEPIEFEQWVDKEACC